MSTYNGELPARLKVLGLCRRSTLAWHHREIPAEAPFWTEILATQGVVISR